MRTIVRYEGEGHRRRPQWSENVPAEPMLNQHPKGALVVGASEAELHRAQVRRHKAAKRAAAS